MGSGLVALCCAVGSACGDGDDSEGCLLQPEQGKAEAAGTLVYAVSGSAIAQVFKVVYATPAGEKTVDNPTLPFSVSLEVPAGASMHLEVTGSASPGASIMAGYSLRTADASAGAAVSATCQH
ncbi:MAG TPA: hypothetical protein VFZ61_31990 [Polyangiales bacterium]